MSTAKLKRDIEIVRRALIPRDNSRGQEILEIMSENERLHEEFKQLPYEEQQRFIQELRDSPATEFAGDDPRMTIYVESLKRATIRNLESASARSRR